MLPLIFECETSDPDDFLTLCWLADHPQVDLRAVVVTPGGRDQCQLVRWGLDQCGRTDVPIGAFHDTGWWSTNEGQKSRVSAFHYKVFGEEPRTRLAYNVARGPELLGRLLADPHAGITYLIGSAPKNLGQAHREFGELRLERLVFQGFFAGDNLVAKEDRLAKFDGKTTCPSFNPGGDPKSSLELLASDHIRQRLLVSKNVCHGVRWTQAMRNALIDRANSRVGNERAYRRGLQLMFQGFDDYLRYGTRETPKPEWEMESERAGQGKAMHDLVAAACALDEGVCEFEEVEVYRERGEWGARIKEGTRTRISVRFNRERFLDVLSH